MTDNGAKAVSQQLKRRSTRVALALPLVVTGVDALGRPFQERTSTAIVNCHGCRYRSDHFVLKDARVLLEVAHTDRRHKTRTVGARIASVHLQGGNSFIFGVELETAGNLWDIEFPPPDWFSFPEPSAPETRMHAQSDALAANPASGDGLNDRSRGSAEDRPGATPAESEQLFAYARQIAQWMDESNFQLRSAIPEGANHANLKDVPPLLKSINAQTQDTFPEDANRGAAERPAQNIDYSGLPTPPRIRSQSDAPHAQRQRDEMKRTYSWSDQLRDELHQQMTEAITEVQSWRARLHADLASATNVWNEQIEKSIESASERAAEHITLSTREIGRQLEQDAATRVDAIGKSFMETTSQAELQLAAVRTSLDVEIKRAGETLSQISAVVSAVRDQTPKLLALTETTQQELEGRASAIIGRHSQELVSRAEKNIADWRGRLQSVLESTGQSIVTKLGTDLEQELNSRLHRASEMLSRLEAETHQAEDLVRMRQNQFAMLSEQAIAAVTERIDKTVATLESKIEGARAAVETKWSATVGSAATSDTFDAPENHFGLPGSKEQDVAANMEGALNRAVVVPLPSVERRDGRRLKVPRPILATPSDPRHKEAVETALNASRNGVYFTTQSKHYYVGMHLRVTIGYAPNDPCNSSSFGEIVRIDRQADGSFGIAVRIFLR